MPDAQWSILINTILARVRDPGASMHPRAHVMDLLTRLQWLYNVQGAYALLTTSLTVRPHLALYSLTEATGDDPSGPQGIMLLKVTQHNRPLDRLTLSQLSSIHPLWFRHTASRLEGFIQFGSSLVLLWPLLTVESPVTLTWTHLTPSLDSTGPQGLLSIPGEAAPRLGQLLELLLLLRGRDMLPFKDLLANFIGEPQNATRPQT